MSGFTDIAFSYSTDRCNLRIGESGSLSELEKIEGKFAWFSYRASNIINDFNLTQIPAINLG